MDKILGVLGGVQSMKNTNDDDSSDRLSHKYTTIMLMAFAAVVSTSQFVGEPIHCWVPAHFSEGWLEYTNSYCWVTNTYRVNFDRKLPAEPKHKNELIYYQWVPIFLLTSALFFYMPVTYWRWMNNKSGVDIKGVVNEENVEKQANILGKYLQIQDLQDTTKFTISLKHLLSKTCCLCCRGRSKKFLISNYLITKFLYFLNSLAQLFMLNLFLGYSFNMYGFEVVRNLIRGTDNGTDRFPKVTFCDLDVRRLGNVNKYTVQCVLSINLFNEKIFIFVWFWIVFLLVVQCLSIFKFVIKTFIRSDADFIFSHIDGNDVHDETDLRDFAYFVGKDGVFILRMVGINKTSLKVDELTNALWRFWLKKDDDTFKKNDVDEGEKKKKLSVDEYDANDDGDFNKDAKTRVCDFVKKECEILKRGRKCSD